MQRRGSRPRGAFALIHTFYRARAIGTYIYIYIHMYYIDARRAGAAALPYRAPISHRLFFTCERELQSLSRLLLLLFRDCRRDGAIFPREREKRGGGVVTPPGARGRDRSVSPIGARDAQRRCRGEGVGVPWCMQISSWLERMMGFFWGG